MSTLPSDDTGLTGTIEDSQTHSITASPTKQIISESVLGTGMATISSRNPRLNENVLNYETLRDLLFYDGIERVTPSNQPQPNIFDLNRHDPFLAHMQRMLIGLEDLPPELLTCIVNSIDPEYTLARQPFDQRSLHIQNVIQLIGMAGYGKITIKLRDHVLLVMGTGEKRLGIVGYFLDLFRENLQLSEPDIETLPNSSEDPSLRSWSITVRISGHGNRRRMGFDTGSIKQDARAETHTTRIIGE